MKRLLDRVDTPLGLVAFLREAFRPCALKRVDRLLFIAHGKERATPHAGAFTGKKIRCERLDDRPLHRACVLRFVNENMVDALIELVVNPGAGRIPIEQIGGALDQVVEIELASLLFQILEIADQPLGQHERALGCAQHPHQPVPVATGNHVVPRQSQGINEIGRGFLHRLVDDIGIRLFFALCRQQRRLDEFHPPEGIGLTPGFSQRVSNLNDTGAANLVRKREVRVERQSGKTRKRPEGGSCALLGFASGDLHVLSQASVEPA